MTGERVVLARADVRTWHGFAWSGAEPDGLYDRDEAVALGARWEGDELVTYDLRALRHAVARKDDPYLVDSD